MTEYVPAGVALVVETVRFDLAEPPAVRVTLGGFRTTVGPLANAGETAAVRLTEPVKPPTLVKLILNIAERPGVRIETCGLAETVKLLEITVMLAMNVDQAPPVVEMYSPATQTTVVLEGSTPAPKKSPYLPFVSSADPNLRFLG